MNIHLVLFVSSATGHSHRPGGVALMKTFESAIRPVAGDVLDDPGFHPAYHNGYEVVKVTLNYAAEECWVSLAPLAQELETIPAASYVDHLMAHGWHALTKERMQQT